jgi:hypothetical protein
MRVRIFSILLLSLIPTVANADDVNAKDQVYTLLMEKILQGIVGSDHGERFTGSVGKKNPYRDRPTQKVMVACVTWSQVTATRAPFKYWNSVFNARSLMHAREEALAFCKSQGKADCDCQVIDENDQNVLQIPSMYLTKLNSDAKGQVQPVNPSSNLEIIQAPTNEPSERRIPIALSWDGVGDLLPGHLNYAKDARSSWFEISLPLLDERCTGHMNISYVSPDKRGRSGVWALACPGQKAATGTFQISADGNGTCAGQDIQGRAIKCAFSER